MQELQQEKEASYYSPSHCSPSLPRDKAKAQQATSTAKAHPPLEMQVELQPLQHQTQQQVKIPPPSMTLEKQKPPQHQVKQQGDRKPLLRRPRPMPYGVKLAIAYLSRLTASRQLDPEISLAIQALEEHRQNWVQYQHRKATQNSTKK